MIPIFGTTFINSDGRRVDVKDLCEEDHLLPDYRRRFIPTLSDFVDCIDDNAIKEGLAPRIERFHCKFATNQDVSELMLSPLMVTGQLISLLITHNSWFINSILPKFFNTQPMICDFSITPSALFDAMNFQVWMDNGAAYPPSARRFANKIITRAT